MIAQHRSQTVDDQKEGPLISVIVATYNRAQALNPTLESILAQSWRKLELIVVDDGSPDDTESVVEGMVDSRIRYVCHADNMGVATAYNTGLNAANGDLIAFLDHDDIAEPHWLERLARAFENAPDVGMAWGQVRQHYLDGSTGLTFLDPYSVGNRRLLPIMLMRTPGASGVMFRREIFETVGTMDPGVGWMADRDLSMRVAISGQWQVCPVPCPMFHKYATGANLSEARNNQHVANLKHLLNKHAQCIALYPEVRAYYLYQIARFSDLNHLPGGRNYLTRAVKLRPLNMKYLLCWLATSPHAGKGGQLLMNAAKHRTRVLSWFKVR